MSSINERKTKAIHTRCNEPKESDKVVLTCIHELLV